MWMKIDDGLHAHRKTRAVIKSHESKRKDAAPMGIWALAGSWASQNGTDGWVPEDELDRWDEEWPALVSRLVRAGFWWPQERDGETGYGFTDWHDYNDPADLASKSGTYGNHVRWHVNEKRAEPGCEHCPQEPDDRGDIAPESGGDRGAISGGDSRIPSGAIALPEPDPNPTRTPKTSSADADIDAGFADWYEAYPRKDAKGAAIKAYRTARKKTDAATLLTAVRSQTPRLLAGDKKFIPLPASWLNAERWLDEGTVTPDPARPETLPPVETSWMRTKS